MSNKTLKRYTIGIAHSSSLRITVVARSKAGALSKVRALWDNDDADPLFDVKYRNIDSIDVIDVEEVKS